MAAAGLQFIRHLLEIKLSHSESCDIVAAGRVTGETRRWGGALMGIASNPTAKVDEFCEIAETGPAVSDRRRDVQIVARIRGHVQGVGYRYWTRVRAERLGLKGYVRNLTDGSVEALFMGEMVDVARMLAYCEEGPAKARVDAVDTERPSAWHPLDLNRFRRAPTRNPGDPV